MAKKQKTEASGAEAAPKKPVRRLKKKAEAAVTSGTPMIDTNLAAQSAARMLAARAKLGNAAAATGNKETSTFKHLKESLNKPAASLASNALGGNFEPQKSHLSSGPQGQAVHNQAQGVGRFNVPRRTAG